MLTISANSYAETVKGCQINSQAFLYTDYVGVREYAINQWYKPTYETYTQAQTAEFLTAWYNPNNCPHFQNVNIGSPQCAVQGITYVSGGNIYNLGNTVIYELTYPNCSPDPMSLPLDDYTGLFIAAISTLGFYVIIKKRI